MDKRPIGMFDSGVGGITVFKEVISTMPNEDVIYIGDSASFPYGSKSKETIIELSKKQVENLIEKGAKLIVIACGTATSQALEEMQSMFSVPIIGIIEPTVAYLEQQKMKKIGVIATSGTIRSKGWEKVIQSQIKGCEIQSKACPLLAPMAEEGWTNNEIAKLAIHEYMKDFTDIDSLVLGCTHYPLFRELIEKEVKKETKIINTGEMVAKSVQTYLIDHGLENEKSHQPSYKIYLTDTEGNFIHVVNQLIDDTEIMKNIEKI